MTLLDILQKKKYNTDKHTKHTYIQDFYDDNFIKFKETNLNFLEIGVWNGESMKLWSDYFINADHIIGIDMFTRNSIDNVRNNLTNYNVNLFKMDTVKDDDNVFNEFTSTYNIKFDIIIDDGCHNPNSQVKTYKRFHKLMNTGGLYIIEDIADSLEAETLICNEIPNVNIITNNKDKFGVIYF